MSSRSAGGAIFLLESGLAAAAALRAADHLGVISCLRAGEADATTVAERCRIGRRGTRALLACLHALGAVEHQGDGTYVVADGADVGLQMGRMWNGLEAALREDAPTCRADQANGAQSFYPDVVPLIGAATLDAARTAAGYLAASKLDVLDLGAGAAPWSLALVEAEPSIRVTAVDLPAVVRATRTAVRERGFEEQFTFVETDLFDAPWREESADLVIVANILHLFDAKANQRLLQLAAAALRPGGKLAIVDVVLDEDCHGPRRAVLYSLSLLLRTESGGAYPLSMMRDWLHAAGLDHVKSTDLEAAAPLSLVTAVRGGR